MRSVGRVSPCPGRFAQPEALYHQGPPAIGRPSVKLSVRDRSVRLYPAIYDHSLPRPRGDVLTPSFLELHNMLAAEIEAETT